DDMEHQSTTSLKRKAMLLKPSVQIGKKGLSEESIKEIDKQLKKHGLVKVKFLRSSLEQSGRKEMATEIAIRTGARIITKSGFMAVYYRPIKQKII
ncbi:MAG TPA: YhbY family RNA-binding protein, partial [Candidatus Nanoarchaeia archaeon]|nr:YhbY family RNA-binding protein [Candidatus Nanoarchaeia archaeon]